MKNIKCRCGEQNKNFKYDIGPFYIAECCEAKGYDAKGNLKGGAPKSQAPAKVEAPKVEEPKDEALEQEAETEEAQEPVTPGPGEGETAESVPGDTSLLQKFFGRAGGRGKLMDMKIEDLKAKAKEKGIQGADQMTKKQLVAAILG